MDEEIQTSPMGTNAKLDKLINILTDENGKVKSKKKNPRVARKFNMPWGGKLGNARLRQGYVTIIQIDENSALTFKKEKIIDSTIKLGDTFHAIGKEDTMTYKGKPILIIAKKDKKSFNPNSAVNNTFAQKHIMSRMMNEVIGTAKKLSLAGMSIGAIILIGVIAYAFIAG